MQSQTKPLTPDSNKNPELARLPLNSKIKKSISLKKLDRFYLS
jgi:hypothetical protein